MTNDTTTLTSAAPTGSALADASLAHPTWDDVTHRIAARTFGLLATSSPSQHPHVAGVLYAEADGALYISIERESRKGRNIAANHRVSVTVPIRRIPFGPPSTAMFQAHATLLDNDDPLITQLADAGRITAVTSHGERDHPEGCFVRVEPPQVIHTYGLGISLLTLMREPLRGGGRVERK
jgi:hypothetical protein